MRLRALASIVVAAVLGNPLAAAVCLMDCHNTPAGSTTQACHQASSTDEARAHGADHACAHRPIDSSLSISGGRGGPFAHSGTSAWPAPGSGVGRTPLVPAGIASGPPGRLTSSACVTAILRI